MGGSSPQKHVNEARLKAKNWMAVRSRRKVDYKSFPLAFRQLGFGFVSSFLTYCIYMKSKT